MLAAVLRGAKAVTDRHLMGVIECAIVCEGSGGRVYSCRRSLLRTRRPSSTHRFYGWCAEWRLLFPSILTNPPVLLVRLEGFYRFGVPVAGMVSRADSSGLMFPAMDQRRSIAVGKRTQWPLVGAFLIPTVLPVVLIASKTPGANRWRSRDGTASTAVLAISNAHVEDATLRLEIAVRGPICCALKGFRW